MPPRLLDALRAALFLLQRAQDPATPRQAPATSAQTGELRAFRATLVGTLVTSVGLGLTLPFTFVYFHRVLALPLPVVGVVVAAAAVLALGATTTGGVIADQIGLGRVAVLGLVLQAGGTVLLALAREPVAGGAGLAVLSMGNSLVWPSLNGLITYQVPPEGRSRAFAVRFGLMNVGIGAGSLIAAATVSVTRPDSFHLLYLLDGATTAVFALILLLGLRNTAGWTAHAHHTGEQHTGEQHTGEHRAGEVVPAGYRTVLRDRHFAAYLVVLLALAVFGSSQTEGPWAAFVALTPAGSAQVIGWGFAANTAAIIVFQLPVERWTRGLRRSRLLVWCALLGAVAWVLTGIAGLPGLPGVVAATLLVLALGVFGVGETFLSPVINAMPNALAPDHLRGRYNALNSATYPVSKFIGPPLAGVLIGGATPNSWVAVVTLGMLAAAGGAVLLGRRLPLHVELPAH
ncbi:MFS family permease [Kineococcus radiotolerans]|uniref:MFS family permease n=1 Tax=Kineococcus radiotolerans TaxID=131568 RepID=A0A7W4XZ30_KINRA|nr:MFS transporter [Kineococcus radiotolerans]MBB2903648.1 MFS family permease [Kineococcus radiotolerans]